MSDPSRSIARDPGSGAPIAEARLSRLIVGYDASPGADAAAGFAFEIAARTGAHVTLLHAGPTPEMAPSGDLLPDAAEQVVGYERTWRARMNDVGQPAPATVRLARGNPAGALIAGALEVRADLLLVGSHGVGRVRGALGGSVSSQLLSHAPCSVMVFREPVTPPVGMPRAVLVGVDGSDGSAHAVRIGQALAVALDARLILIHAYDPHVPFAGQPSRQLAELARRHGRAVIDEARATAAAPFNTELIEGDARTALAGACAAHAPALLVVGSRGLGGFKELLLGSTARSLAACAPCPVVVARPPFAKG